jgi:hypothetical protein
MTLRSLGWFVWSWRPWPTRLDALRALLEAAK